MFGKRKKFEEDVQVIDRSGQVMDVLRQRIALLPDTLPNGNQLDKKKIATSMWLVLTGLFAAGSDSRQNIRIKVLMMTVGQLNAATLMEQNDLATAALFYQINEEYDRWKLYMLQHTDSMLGGGNAEYFLEYLQETLNSVLTGTSKGKAIRDLMATMNSQEALEILPDAFRGYVAIQSVQLAPIVVPIY